MRDSRAIDAERAVQHRFSKIEILQLLILGLTVLLIGRWLSALPDRAELGERAARVIFRPVTFDPRGFAPLKLAGAWRLTSNDPRFGGVSGLSLDEGHLLALTDSGAVMHLAKPHGAFGSAVIRELPGGPGDPRFKSRRDSEALMRDWRGRGWWIAFENRNEVWLYDPGFERAVGRAAFGLWRWPRNRGVEAVASEGDALLLFPERGDHVVEVRGSLARTTRIENPAGRISDAVRLPSGKLLVLNRRLTPLGFASSVATLERTAAGFRYGPRVRLRLSAFDNAEALAPEQLPDGRVRLWLMTDDNFQRPFRTLLIALDMPAAPKRARPRRARRPS